LCHFQDPNANFLPSGFYSLSDEHVCPHSGGWVGVQACWEESAQLACTQSLPKKWILDWVGIASIFRIWDRVRQGREIVCPSLPLIFFCQREMLSKKFLICNKGALRLLGVSPPPSCVCTQSLVGGPHFFFQARGHGAVCAVLDMNFDPLVQYPLLSRAWAHDVRGIEDSEQLHTVCLACGWGTSARNPWDWVDIHWIVCSENRGRFIQESLEILPTLF